MPFRDAIVSGLTLVRDAIRSSNYVPGVSGWSINRDGTAEFLSAIIRGSLGADVFRVPVDAGDSTGVPASPIVPGYFWTSNQSEMPAELVSWYGYGGTTGIHAVQIGYAESGGYHFIAVFGSDEVRKGWVNPTGDILETEVWDWADLGAGPMTRIKYMGNTAETRISFGANAEIVDVFLGSQSKLKMGSGASAVPIQLVTRRDFAFATASLSLGAAATLVTGCTFDLDPVRANPEFEAEITCCFQHNVAGATQCIGELYIDGVLWESRAAISRMSTNFDVATETQIYSGTLSGNGPFTFELRGRRSAALGTQFILAGHSAIRAKLLEGLTYA